MAEDFLSFRNNVNFFLNSFRYSLDRILVGRSRSSDAGGRDLLQAMMLIEEARLQFRIALRTKQPPNQGKMRETLRNLSDFTKSFTIILDGSKLGKVPFTPALTYKESTDIMANVPDAVPSGRSGAKITVHNAVLMMQTYLLDSEKMVKADKYSLPSSALENLADLRRIVPDQQVAPVQFDIREGRIIVSEQRPVASDTNRMSLQEALNHIKESGRTLIENLHNSNCDPRLVQSVMDLQSQVIESKNVVKLGLTNIGCGIIAGQFQTELPNAIAGMLSSYNVSVALYVAQFPEWEEFSRKAASIEIAEDDLENLSQTASEIAEELEKNPSIADIDVPKTILFIRQFLDLPGSSSRRAALAMLRTIENLVSSIIRYSVSFLEKTADKAVEGASTIASKALVTLLGIALVSASGIGPAASRVGAPWVQQAAEIVQQQIVRMLE